MALHLLDPSRPPWHLLNRPLRLLLAQEANRLPQDELQAMGLGMRSNRIPSTRRQRDLDAARSELGRWCVQVEQRPCVWESCGRHRAIYNVRPIW